MSNNSKKVSIVVPVYNVEKYIDRCLESLVNQTLKDIEIIVVNDGSTDNSKEVIEKYQKEYPEMLKVYTIKNSGAAKARNIGLEKASGEYIGFVDSDDFVSKTMFEELYNKAINDNADIVKCAYYRVQEDKCIERETDSEYDYGKSIHEDKSLIINSTPYIWNKIFRKKMLDSYKIKFPDIQIYEDLVFTYKSFMVANKISKVNNPLYYYIVIRENSLTFKFSEKRFDIFPAFKELTSFAKKIDCLEELREEMLFILLKHVYVVLEKDSSRSTAGMKEKYINKIFNYLDKNFDDWKDNIYFEKYNKDKKKYTSKLYWRYRIIFNKNKRKKIKKVVNVIKSTLTNKENLGKEYLKQRKSPIDEKLILLNSQQGDNINGNMFYLLKELQNEKYNDFKIFVAHKDEKKENFCIKLNSYGFRYELVSVNSKKYTKILATAKYLFNDTSFPTYFIKREQQIYLNTWHGTPLKTLGKATVNDFYDIANLQKNFVVANYLLYPSQYMIDHMMEDFMLDNIATGKIMLCGYPRNEVFFDTKRREELKSELDMTDKEIIAYMPTWRGNVRNVSLEEQLEEIKEYLEKIDKSLKDNQILYVNFHPYVGNNIDFEVYNRIKAFPEEYETYDFLNACDTLITDYSSVFFDYAITRNKIILFTYDEEEYLRDRGMYISLDELPFPKVETVDQLIKEINKPKSYNDDDFLKKYCYYDTADVSSKICNYIILNKKVKLEIKEIKKNNRKNILIYAGALNKNKVTDKLISATKDVQKSTKYNYYITYITKKIKKNKRQLSEMKDNGIYYMGQLGILSNVGKIEKIILSLAGKIKQIYNLFNRKIDSIYMTELNRIYGNAEFSGIILYGKIGIRKIYEFSNLKGRKIIYLTDKNDFNKKVNKKIYERYDYILSDNEEVIKEVKKFYNNINIMKTEEFKDLNYFDKYIN